MIHVGIDYSMTSPAVCIHRGVSFSVNNCTIYFLTKKKKLEGNSHFLSGDFYPDYEDQERYNFLSKWVIEKLWREESPIKIAIEDYSYGSKGRVFHIAENTGLLKHKLWKIGLSWEAVPPTVLKKFATEKGNADKAQMEVAFVKETGYNPKQMLGMTEKQWNPSSDIIDSFYLCKWSFYASQN